jgi:hypothetical protein
MSTIGRPDYNRKRAGHGQEQRFGTAHGYADLIQPDRRTLRFAPYGLAPGELHPDDAVAFQSAVIADADLTEAVLDEIRSEFERLRAKQMRGVIDYGNFAEVGNQAIGLYEPALRLRFLQFYQGRDIPFIERDVTAAPLRADDYDAVYRHVSATKGKHIQGPGGRVWFNGTLHGLVGWARNEGLLRGQRARRIELIIVRQRNRISHGGGYRLESPVTSAEEIRDLGEFINQLWGVPTAGGRIYPAPVTREILALGSGPGGVRRLARTEWLSGAEDPDATWVLLHGVSSREALHFDSRYQTSAIPSEYLWGPGPASDAVRWLDIHRPAPDLVDPLDQLMAIRHLGNRLYLSQTPEIAAAMPPSERTGRWYLLLADHPLTAFACVRAGVDRDPGHHGTCGCATRRLVRGAWPTVRAKIAQLRPDLIVSPLPPDVRVVDEWRFPERYVLVEQSAA